MKTTPLTMDEIDVLDALKDWDAAVQLSWCISQQERTPCRIVKDSGQPIGTLQYALIQRMWLDGLLYDPRPKTAQGSFPWLKITPEGKAALNAHNAKA